MIASCPARLQWLPPLSSETGSQRSSASFAERGHPHVRRVFQYFPNGCTVPDRPAHASSLLGGSEPANDVADRHPLLAHPLEHLPHNPCFVEHDLEPGIAAAFIFSDVAVAIGCSAQDAHLACLSAMPFATAIPLKILARSLCRAGGYADREVLPQRKENAPMEEVAHEVGIIAAS